MQETTTDTTTTTSATEKIEKTIYDTDLTMDQFEKIRRGEKVEVDKPVVSASAGKKADGNQPEPEDTEEVTPDDDESENEDGDEGEEKPKTDETKKKKNGHQKRVDKLTKRALAWEQRALAAEARIVAAEQARKPEDTKVADKKVASAGKPNPDDFEKPAEYYEALAEWKIEEKLKAKEVDEQKFKAKAAVDKIDKDYQERASKFNEKNPDFDTVMREVPVDVSIAFLQAIKESEFGPAIAYELAQNLDELKRVNALNPSGIARAIGRLEAKFETASKPASKQETKITSAPPPVKPVNARSNSGAAKSVYDADISNAEFERIRAKQAKDRGLPY